MNYGLCPIPDARMNSMTHVFAHVILCGNGGMMYFELLLHTIPTRNHMIRRSRSVGWRAMLSMSTKNPSRGEVRLL